MNKQDIGDLTTEQVDVCVEHGVQAYDGISSVIFRRHGTAIDYIAYRGLDSKTRKRWSVYVGPSNDTAGQECVSSGLTREAAIWSALARCIGHAEG